MFSKILIPVALDHEGLIPHKLKIARRLLADGGTVTVLTVLEDVPGYVAEFVTVKSENHLTDLVQARLNQAIAGQEDVTSALASGKAGVEIVRYAANNNCDLIIIGSHRPGIEDYFLGSTAARVARRSPCSVMIAREPE